MIQVKNLTKQFGDVTAVNDISFEVKPGEVFAFLGPNGAGKTTTIKMLTTLVAPDERAICARRHRSRQHPHDVRQRFGIVFQDPSLDGELTALRKHGAARRPLSCSAADARGTDRTAAEAFELWDRRQGLVKTFSGGMKRRLEIARGFLHTPKILFLDEPTLGSRSAKPQSDVDARENSTRPNGSRSF